MKPELFRIGAFAVNSYGVFLALAFVVGLWLTLRLGKRCGLNRDNVLDLSIIVMITSIIGARLLYVLFHLSEFEGRWLYTFIPIQPDGRVGLSGLIFLGGFMGAVAASVLYIRWRKMPMLKTTDSAMPALALGIFFGRIGCLLNGCCFGQVCELPWAVNYPLNSAAYHILNGMAAHPTQLYESGYGLTIFIVLMLMERKGTWEGQLTGWFLVLYGISRFTIDFWRYYEEQMFLFAGLEFNQIVSFVMFITGIYILFKLKPGGSTGSSSLTT
ncbi:MAG: prolipoprotein diacylglyceryl transferase [Calditrichota bacterium]